MPFKVPVAPGENLSLDDTPDQPDDRGRRGVMVLPLSFVDSHRGQWPIAAALGLLMLGELLLMRGAGSAEALVWLLSVPPCIAAVMSFRSRAFAIPVTVMSIFAASFVIRLFDVNLPTILSP